MHIFQFILISLHLNVWEFWVRLHNRVFLWNAVEKDCMHTLELGAPVIPRVCFEFEFWSWVFHVRVSSTSECLPFRTKTTCLIITPAHILGCNTFVGKMRPAYRPLVKSLFRHDYIKQCSNIRVLVYHVTSYTEIRFKCNWHSIKFKQSETIYKIDVS